MYTCKRCGYNTNIKGNLKNHFRRLRTCTPTYSDTPIITLLTELNNNIPTTHTPLTHNHTQLTHNLHNFTHNSHNLTHNSHNLTHNSHTIHTVPDLPIIKGVKNAIVCEFCNKCFARNDSLRRHQKNSCVKAKINNSTTNNLIEDMKKQLEKAKVEKEIMLHEMDKLMDKVGDTNIQNQQFNIHINNFGTENIDYISDNYLKALFDMPYKAVSRLIKNIHFNPDHPENHNIRITNKKLPFIAIWNGSKWVMRDKQLTLIDILDKGFTILDNSYHENGLQLECDKRVALEKFQEEYAENDKSLIKNLNKDLELLIINNSDMHVE